jgi:hypothetical protein
MRTGAKESIMSTSKAMGMAAVVASLAVALGMAAPASAAAPSASSANEHQPPPDVAHKEAKQAVSDRPILRTENADYASAVKACKKLPLSQRTTCISEAGNSTTLAAKARRETGTTH